MNIEVHQSDIESKALKALKTLTTSPSLVKTIPYDHLRPPEPCLEGSEYPGNLCPGLASIKAFMRERRPASTSWDPEMQDISLKIIFEDLNSVRYVISMLGRNSNPSLSNVLFGTNLANHIKYFSVGTLDL